jgi:type I restriction enzyme R subunit
MTKPHPNSPEGKARVLIDKMLQDAGWTIIKEGNPVPERGNFAAEEVETDNGPMDYALFIDGVLFGDVEAKPEGTGVPGIIAQDERYSKGYTRGKFDFNGFHIPFLYSSNGHIIWFRDARSKNNLSREIEKFHTPSALEEYFSRDMDQAYQWLKDHPIETPGLRPYQKEDIESVEHAILSNKRKLMLAMATGTGKTFTAAETIYRLLKSKTAKRILFLVDRRALAAQAVREFAAFEPEPAQKLDKLYEIYSQRFKKEDLGEDSGFDPNVLPNEYLTDPKSNHTFVYVCTIQRMRINLFGRQGMFPWTEEDYYEEDIPELPIPIHAFDVVIADECHRGYTSAEESKWREVLNHFDAIKIGLTATPASHTTAYFRDIVYNYSYEKAVQEGYLVDWDLIKIDSGIRMSGLFLKEGEEIQYVDRRTGEKRYETLEDEKEYDTTALERKATAPESNRLIVKEYAKYAREFEKEKKRFPKTLVFAVNDLPHVSHCDTLVELLSQEFSDKGAGFVQKITGTIDRPLQKIREFRNRPQQPAIVVTVDMLSTGVDIPTLESIVFIRPVRSRILFEQMMGRGTRLARDIGKTHFTVCDAVGVVDYFKYATNFSEPVPAKPTKTYKQIIDEIYNNKNRDYNIKILTRRLQRISKNITPQGRQQLEPFIKDGDIGRFARTLSERLESGWKETIDILRNEQFQRLLEKYPRSDVDFVVAPHIPDMVSSTRYPIVVHGHEYKPDDYLTLFAEFVKNEANTIASLQILLERPRDLNTDLLDDLRKKLAARPEQFTEEHLRRAYGNNLADIIGMIRSAISSEPLLTTRERVQRAMKVVTEGKTLTDDQRRWLDFIANHLEYNLLIEKRHFASIPFSGKGGWKKADQDFNGSLESIITRINEVMTS